MNDNSGKQHLQRLPGQALLLLFVAGFTGCAAPRMPTIADTMAMRGHQLAPLEHRTSLPEAKDAGNADETFTKSPRHTLAMVDMELAHALAALSRLSPVPIVAEKNLEGTVNLVVEDRPLDEILQAMIKPLGYAAYVENGMIVVGKPRLVTRAFFINYLKDKRSSSSTTHASISTSGGAESSSAGTYSSSGRQGNVNVTTSGNSDFWGGLLKGLEGIVFGTAGQESKNIGKRIIVNDLAGVIYVTDTEENMRIVSAFLADIEKEVKRQVLIQAHIVEIDLDNEFSLGIDWKHIISKASTTISQGLAPTPQSGVFKIDVNSSDFSLLLDAFREQGHVNMLSSPKISTMNNQKAVIKLTTKEVTWVNSTTYNADGKILTSSTEPQIDEVGLFLDVTPNIDANGIITMHIHPSISEIKAVSTAPDKSGTKPIINVREVDTMIDVKSGQTVVIAGLISERQREVRRSVPLLGDIPYVGLLFSNLRQERRKSELVIFLTPYILEHRSIEQIRLEHETRLREMNQLSHFIQNRGNDSTH